MTANTRVLELLADQAAAGLNDAEARELESLLNSMGGLRDDSFQSAAAALHASAAPASAIPARLRASLESAGARWAGTHADQPLPFRSGTSKASSGGWQARFGWLAAAACLGLAVIGWWPRLFPPPAAPLPVAVSDADRYQDFLKNANDVVRVNWAPWGENAQMQGVQGEVIWSQERQEGYVRIRGLPVNDSQVEQYQLWVVDTSLGEPLKGPPIPAGVFNVGDSSSEIIIPLNPAVRVGSTFGFGMTKERQGGAPQPTIDRAQLIAIPKSDT